MTSKSKPHTCIQPSLNFIPGFKPESISVSPWPEQPLLILAPERRSDRDYLGMEMLPLRRLSQRSKLLFNPAYTALAGKPSKFQDVVMIGLPSSLSKCKMCEHIVGHRYSGGLYGLWSDNETFHRTFGLYEKGPSDPLIGEYTYYRMCTEWWVYKSRRSSHKGNSLMCMWFLLCCIMWVMDCCSRNHHTDTDIV